MKLRESLPFMVLIFVLMGAFAWVLWSVLAVLMPTETDMGLLLIYMSVSVIVTLGMIALLLRWRVIERFSSLRWTLLTIIITTVTFVIVNVFVAARLMLLNDEDLLLTSALLLFGGVVAIIAALLVSGTLIQRIRQLSDGLERLARGDLTARLHIEGRDELAELGHMFNQMMAQLAQVDENKRQLEQSRRNLVAWASHDLRAPLAAIRAMNEAILDGVVQDEATMLRYRQLMQREIEHMGRLISDLFDLAELDVDASRLERRPVQLASLIAEALEGISVRAREAEIALHYEAGDDVPTLPLDSVKVARALRNLLDNALEHTPQGGSIDVAVCRAGDGAEVRIRNSGSYIEAENLPHVFERFFRGDSARSTRRDGQRSAGLGLAITREFVESHGGHIHVASDRKAGTTFTLWLPA